MQGNYRLTILPVLQEQSKRMTYGTLQSGDVVKYISHNRKTIYFMRTNMEDPFKHGATINLGTGEMGFLSYDGDCNDFTPVKCSLREE